MNEAKRRKVALDNVNKMVKSDPNCLIGTKSGEVNPERAYVDLVRDILQLYQQP